MTDTSSHGIFTLFGFTCDLVGLEQRIRDRLGVEVQTLAPVGKGAFFYYTSDGEAAENDQLVVLKLGYLRSKAGSALNCQDLMKHMHAANARIDTEAFTGNGLVVALHKRERVMTAFQTLLAVPQLYYWMGAGEIICSDVLRCLVDLLPCPMFNEAILPQHFLFRSVYGTATYYRDVERMLPGHLLTWKDGDMNHRLVRSLDVVMDEAACIRADDRAIQRLDEALEAVVGDYVYQAEEVGESYASLLSGGVDLTLVQYYLNQAGLQEINRSISFAIQVPAFEFEVDYARQASRLMSTEHVFVPYNPADYVGLLERVMGVLAQPPNLETEPSFLAVAEYLHAHHWHEKVYFTGQGGDTLFGGVEALKLKGLEYLRRVPGAVMLLRSAGRAAALGSAHGSHLLFKGAEIIANYANPHALCSPANEVAVYVLEQNWDLMRRSFGDQTIQDTLAFRRELVSQYSKSRHYIDQVYMIDLLTDMWELAVQRQQIFLRYGYRQASPYLDEDLLKAAMTIHPDLRYIKGWRYKHLLRRLLDRKTQAPVAREKKGPSNVNDDLVAWMDAGPLRMLVDQIERPAFIDEADFKRLLKKPNYFLWNSSDL